MTKEQNQELQSLTRQYLTKLRGMAKAHGLLSWIDETIKANKRGECESTQKECELLARACDDERISRKDIPEILGISYRSCYENDLFAKVKTLRHVGIYSKISALLLAKKKLLTNK